MNEIIKFLDKHYKNALKLVGDFDITKSKKWNPQIYLNELYVQLGHVYNVLFSDDNVNENKRVINNLGDELSDVLLQLINLANILNIDMYEIKVLKDYTYNDVNGLSILLGQLTEAIMENNECRFKKDRIGFETSYDFVKDRLFKLFIITYNISKQYNLDMVKEFNNMLKDANGFLDRFRKGKRVVKEYIDIYDSNEKLLGYCEKEKAHQLGYWHRVIGCMIYNSKSNKVYFQLKNPKYNDINTRELLEITAGGHLISGEALQNGVREIKEETGLTVDYDSLCFIEKRRCNKKIKSDYTIREFQYFYSLDLDINLLDFNNYDDNEVISFVEVDLDETIKLLDGKITKIKGKMIKNNKQVNIKLKIEDFDSAFVKNGLYLSLLQKIKNMGEVDKMNKKLKKLHKIINHQKMKNPDMFYFDYGKVCSSKDYKKDNIKYSVMLVNTDRNTNNYLVYLLAICSNKSTPQLLKKEFKSKKGTEKYFNELCEYVESNTNQTIIDKCYTEKMKDFDLNSLWKKLQFSLNIFS